MREGDIRGSLGTEEILLTDKGIAAEKRWCMKCLLSIFCSYNEGFVSCLPR